jgi:hypothetical protein
MKNTYTLLLLLFCAVITNAQKITVFNSSNSNLPKEEGFSSSIVVDLHGNVGYLDPAMEIINMMAMSLLI